MGKRCNYEGESRKSIENDGKITRFSERQNVHNVEATSCNNDKRIHKAVGMKRNDRSKKIAIKYTKILKIKGMNWEDCYKYDERWIQSGK